MFDKEIKLLSELLVESKSRDNKELTWLEFKVNNYNDMGEYISALANSAFWNDKESGYIVYGIQNLTLEEVGVSFNPFDLKYQNSKMDAWMSQKITGCSFEFFPFKKDNKEFLIVKVNAIYSTIAKFDNNAYFRIGEHKKNLKDLPEWESKLWAKIHSQTAKTMFTKVFKSNLTKDEVFECIDVETYYFLTAGSKAPINTDLIIDRFLDEGFITKIGNNFNILGIGAVLFAKELKYFEDLKYKAPEVLTYSGNNKLSTVIKTQIGGRGYAVGFLGLIDYIFTQIRQPESISRLRSTQPIYPEKAIREIVANALIHQDFEIGSRVLIEIYDNHIDISNGGGCLFDASRIIDHPPKSRNEPLAEAMRRLNICEKRGSGVDRTIDAIQQIQLPPPKFIDQNDAFVVKLYSHRKYANFTEEEKQRACMQFVELNFELGRSTTNEDLRKRFGIPKTSTSIVSRLIKKCLDKKLIKKFDPENNSKKNTSYIPIFA